MKLKALILNCTLKPSPEVSNTSALIQKVAEVYKELGVETEELRVRDYEVAFGVSSDEGDGDEWPEIYGKIKDCDILVIATPIWFGVRGSVSQMVLERLDGSYSDGDSVTGQYPLYNKVGAVIVTGNEDGAHDVAANTLFNLTHLGCAIAPNSDCYWVGTAGPGPSYIEAGGDKHLYTNRTARYLAHNSTKLAQILAENKIDTNLKDLDSQAKEVSE
jgi:multimeric flavodoxin WrbA